MASKPTEPDTVASTLAGTDATAVQEKVAANPPETAPATGTTELEKKIEAINLVPEERKQESTEQAPATEKPAASDEKAGEVLKLAPEERKQDPAVEAEKKVNATAAAPTTAAPPANSSDGPEWPETGPEHPLTKFYEAIEELTKEAEHDEVWGIKLSPTNPFLTKLILQKYLRANANDLTKAKEQLSDTLKWRKEFEPAKAAEASYETDIFEGLGYVVEIEGVPESTNKKDIVTFNVYGAVKDNKKTFGDLETCVSIPDLNICPILTHLTASSSGVSVSWSAPSRNSILPLRPNLFRTTRRVPIRIKASRSTTTFKCLSSARILVSLRPYLFP